MEDERIVSLFWDRDEQAITESSKKYGSYCRSIAHNILADPADEEGVTGAAYTMISDNGTSLPTNEIDLVFDRPFMFVLTGNDGTVLFSGVVRNIE